MDRLEVARFSTLPEAELVASFLQRHGIDAQVADREMGNSMPHLQFALGGLRVTAPAFQIGEARRLIAEALSRVTGDGDLSDSDDWMIDATPGHVGELEQGDIRGVMGGMKKAAGLLVGGLAIFSLANCVLTWVLPEA